MNPVPLMYWLNGQIHLTNLQETKRYESGKEPNADGKSTCRQQCFLHDMVRLSGAENIYKIYEENFRGADHLRNILEEAQGLVSDVLDVRAVASISSEKTS